MAEELRISLFGQATYELGGQPLDSLTSVKARALLIYLAVTGRPHSRAKLAGLLWPDVLESSARGSLRTTLMRLRKSIDGYLTSSEDFIGIEPSRALWLDLHEFENACKQLKGDKASLAE